MHNRCIAVQNLLCCVDPRLMKPMKRWEFHCDRRFSGYLLFCVHAQHTELLRALARAERGRIYREP